MSVEVLIIWTCAVVFVLTAMITLLGIIEEPKILKINDKWLKPLYAALILEIVGVCVYVFKTHFDEAESVGSAEITVSVPKLISTMKDENVTKDYFRMFFLKSGSNFSGKLGKPSAKRVFVTPSAGFSSPMSLGVVANYLGNDYRTTEDVYLLRCQPEDPRSLDPKLATWPNVFDLISQDFPYENCESPSLEHERASCIAQKYGSTSANSVAINSIFDMYTGAANFYDEGLGDFLKNEYGISRNSFIGTGHTVSGSGAGKKYRAKELLKKANIPEYLVRNVSISDGSCKCIVVTPYSKRQKQKFDISIFDSIGEVGRCLTLEKLPNNLVKRT